MPEEAGKSRIWKFVEMIAFVFYIYCYEILHKYYLSLMLYREKRLATVAKKKNNGLMIHFENWSVDSKKSKEGDKKKRKWDLVVTS